MMLAFVFALECTSDFCAAARYYTRNFARMIMEQNTGSFPPRFQADLPTDGGNGEPRLQRSAELHSDYSGGVEAEIYQMNANERLYIAASERNQAFDDAFGEEALLTDKNVEALVMLLYSYITELTDRFVASTAKLASELPAGDICVRNDSKSSAAGMWSSVQEYGHVSVNLDGLSLNAAARACYNKSTSLQRLVELLKDFKAGVYGKTKFYRGFTYLNFGNLAYMYPQSAVPVFSPSKSHNNGIDTYIIILDPCFSRTQKQDLESFFPRSFGLYNRRQQAADDSSIRNSSLPFMELIDLVINKPQFAAVNFNVINGERYHTMRYLYNNRSLLQQWMRSISTNIYRNKQSNQCKNSNSENAIREEIENIVNITKRKLNTVKQASGKAYEQIYLQKPKPTLILMIDTENNVFNPDIRLVFGKRAKFEDDKYWKHLNINFAYFNIIRNRTIIGNNQIPRMPQFLTYKEIYLNSTIAAQTAEISDFIDAWIQSSGKVDFMDQFTDLSGNIVVPLCMHHRENDSICEGTAIFSLLGAYSSVRYQAFLISKTDFSIRASFNPEMIGRQLGFGEFNNLDYHHMQAMLLKKRCRVVIGSENYYFANLDSTEKLGLLVYVDFSFYYHIPVAGAFTPGEGLILCQGGERLQETCNMHAHIFGSHFEKQLFSFDENFFAQFRTLPKAEFQAIYPFTNSMYISLSIALSQQNYDSLLQMSQYISSMFRDEDVRIIRAGHIFGYIDSFIGGADYSVQIYSLLDRFHDGTKNYQIGVYFEECQMLDQKFETNMQCLYLMAAKKHAASGHITYTNYIVVPRSVFELQMSTSQNFDWGKQGYGIVFQLNLDTLTCIILRQDEDFEDPQNYLRFRLYDMGLLTCGFSGHSVYLKIAGRLAQIIASEYPGCFCDAAGENAVYYDPRFNFVVVGMNYVAALSVKQEVCPPQSEIRPQIAFYADDANYMSDDDMLPAVVDFPSNAANIVACAFLLVLLLAFCVALLRISFPLR